MTARVEMALSSRDQAARATSAGASQYRGVWIINSSEIWEATSSETIPASKACSNPTLERRTTL